MTNFEKWKNELIPEKLLYLGFHSGNPYKAAVFRCSFCPADSCPRKDSKCISHDAICEREFLKWAGSKVKSAGPEEQKSEEDEMSPDPEYLEYLWDEAEYWAHES